jgi:hypothetical protein
LITPNIPEAETLLQTKISDLQGMQEATFILTSQYNMSVLLKGGHLDGEHSSDIFYDYPQRKIHPFDSLRIPTQNTHGTGCTLSAAIASYLAQGNNLYNAIVKAKHYLTQCILAAKNLKIGHGHGPVHHFYFLDFDELCAGVVDVMPKIYQHPFNQELAQGTLALEKFIFYLNQDALYLADFSKTLALTATRLPPMRQESIAKAMRVEEPTIGVR